MANKVFEYMTKEVYQGGKPGKQEMNELGEQGWELVSVIGRSDLAGWTRAEFEYIFKREILQPRLRRGGPEKK